MNKRDKMHAIFVAALAMLILFDVLSLSPAYSTAYSQLIDIALIMLGSAVISGEKLFGEVTWGNIQSQQTYLKTLAVSLAIAIPYFIFITSNSGTAIPLVIVGSTYSFAQMGVLILLGVEIECLLFDGILVSTVATNLGSFSSLALLALFGALVAFISFNSLQIGIVFVAIAVALFLLKMKRVIPSSNDPMKHLVAIAIVGTLFSLYHIWTGASASGLAVIFCVLGTFKLVNWAMQDTMPSRILHSTNNAGMVTLITGNMWEPLAWVGIYILILTLLSRGRFK